MALTFRSNTVPRSKPGPLLQSPGACGLGGLVFPPEVRASLPGDPLRLRQPPGLDLGVMTGDQHLRHGARRAVVPRPDCRPRVVRVFQQARRKTLLLGADLVAHRSEEHTSDLQSLMRISYAVFC